jgi:hypothetical protein
VAARRRQVELSVERPLAGRGPDGGVARLTAIFEAGPGGEGPSAPELARALEELVRELDGVLGAAEVSGPPARADRDLRELVETYRPRQRELVDLLLADGELSPTEHALLRGHLDSHPPAPAGPAPPPADLGPVGETPIAAVPLAADRKLPPARPVPELVRTYQIASLRQAGAVRARRQISFAEYMALKRHFEAAEGKEPAPSPGESI